MRSKSKMASCSSYHHQGYMHPILFYNSFILSFLFLFQCGKGLHSSSGEGSRSSSLSFSIKHIDAAESPFRATTPTLQHQKQEEEGEKEEIKAMEEFIHAGISLRSRLKHGANQRGSGYYARGLRGEFYVVVGVGTPPQQAVLILDTGSDLTWTPYTNNACPQNHDINSPPFQPDCSSSFSPLPCTSHICPTSTECPSNTSSCPFLMAYADGNQYTGNLAIDTFHIEPTSSIPSQFLFGCVPVDTHNQSQLLYSGVMGLNQEPISFSSQIFESTGYAKKFRYCMPDRLNHLNSNGSIIFGEWSSNIATKLSYTPLSPPFPPLGSSYYLPLVGISVKKKKMMLNIPKSTLLGDGRGNGGTILDSGTIITLLTDVAFTPLLEAMRVESQHLHPFSMGTIATDVCYNISVHSTQLPKVPSIAFHFKGGVILELNQENILYPASVDESTITLCLAFASSNVLQGVSHLKNIIGNYQLQNYWVEYDIQNMRIGFAKANCAH